MEELVNFIITIVHFFKYGTKVNRNRSFKMELSTAIQIKDENLPVLQKLVNAQLSSLLIKGNGIPTYAYIKRQKEDWYKVIIINREENFYCRLEPTEIKDLELPKKCYIFL
jgi:hypothetical protein